MHKAYIDYIPKEIAQIPVCNALDSAWKGLDTILGDIIDRFEVPKNTALEFGVQYGYSTSAFSYYFNYVVAVDTFTGDDHCGKGDSYFEQTKGYLAGYKNIQLVESSFQDFIVNNDSRYDMIHIDIVHYFNETYKCGMWAIAHSDVVLFHDVFHPDILGVCTALAHGYGLNFYCYESCCGLGILTKKEIPYRTIFKTDGAP